ncbi:hypothetical protein [Methylobacterium sp. WL119]|uniref:hypothetical protein n=1 Tax=Methylobacterium sp. WL119 TaxID=2603888 RepID=UPI00164EE3A9|nr:hypothetical protein [Methylobacterium sp. WL119]
MPLPRIRVPVPLAVDPVDPALSHLPPDPLTWWRQVPPSTFDLAAQRILLEALRERVSATRSIDIAACLSDPAAAVRAALTALSPHPTRGDRVASPDDASRDRVLDLALSAAALCAAQGDPACAAVLVHALGRRARRRADLAVLCLAHAWRRPVTDPAGIPVAPTARR